MHYLLKPFTVHTSCLPDVLDRERSKRYGLLSQETLGALLSHFPFFLWVQLIHPAALSSDFFSLGLVEVSHDKVPGHILSPQMLVCSIVLTSDPVLNSLSVLRT